jgi:hypothetical protein
MREKPAMSENAQILAVAFIGSAVLMCICLGVSVWVRSLWFQAGVGNPPVERKPSRPRRKKK